MSSLCRSYLFIFHAKLVTALVLLQLQINPVILWFGRMDGSVFRISWLKKEYSQEDSAIHHCMLCSYSSFSANISLEQYMPCGWLKKMKKERFRVFLILACKHAQANINIKLKIKYNLILFNHNSYFPNVLNVSSSVWMYHALFLAGSLIFWWYASIVAFVLKSS